MCVCIGFKVSIGYVYVRDHYNNVAHRIMVDQLRQLWSIYCAFLIDRNQFLTLNNFEQ